MAWAEAYLHTKWHLDPFNSLATIHQRYRQTGQTDRSGQTDNGLIAQGEPFYKRLPPKTYDNRTELTILDAATKQNKSSAVAEMGDRGHNRHGPKRGGCAPFAESWDPVQYNVA